jgi:probable rRNA maturation factor
VNETGLRVLVDIAPQFEGHVHPGELEHAVTAALTVADRDRALPWKWTEVSVRVTTDEEIHRLNHQYRGVDRPTDVLSFSFVEDMPDASHPRQPDGVPVQLGEVILAFPYALRQAADLGYPVETELAWLTIHGALQLAGYTHDTDDAAEHMEALEREALAILGITVE